MTISQCGKLTCLKVLCNPFHVLGQSMHLSKTISSLKMWASRRYFSASEAISADTASQVQWGHKSFLEGDLHGTAPSLLPAMYYFIIKKNYWMPTTSQILCVLHALSHLTLIKTLWSTIIFCSTLQIRKLWHIRFLKDTWTELGPRDSCCRCRTF